MLTELEPQHLYGEYGKDYQRWEAAAGELKKSIAKKSELMEDIQIEASNLLFGKEMARGKSGLESVWLMETALTTDKEAKHQIHQVGRRQLSLLAEGKTTEDEPEKFAFLFSPLSSEAFSVSINMKIGNNESFHIMEPTIEQIPLLDQSGKKVGETHCALKYDIVLSINDLFLRESFLGTGSPIETNIGFLIPRIKMTALKIDPHNHVSDLVSHFDPRIARSRLKQIKGFQKEMNKINADPWLFPSREIVAAQSIILDVIQNRKNLS